jgi:hypothetical protein
MVVSSFWAVWMRMMSRSVQSFGSIRRFTARNYPGEELLDYAFMASPPALRTIVGFERQVPLRQASIHTSVTEPFVPVREDRIRLARAAKFAGSHSEARGAPWRWEPGE